MEKISNKLVCLDHFYDTHTHTPCLPIWGRARIDCFAIDCILLKFTGSCLLLLLMLKNLTQCVHLLDLFAFVANTHELVVYIAAVAASAAAAFALKAARK